MPLAAAFRAISGRLYPVDHPHDGGDQLPFYVRRPYKLNVFVRRETGAGLVQFTNVAEDDATIFYLVRCGYGSLQELQQLDTPQLFDIVEYEQIRQDLETYHLDKSRES